MIIISRAFIQYFVFLPRQRCGHLSFVDDVAWWAEGKSEKEVAVAEALST